MHYRTVIGPADKIDADVNVLASEGWIVQQGFVCGAIDIAGGTPEEPIELEMPVIAYLMFKQDNAQGPEPVEPERPQRKVIGRGLM